MPIRQKKPDQPAHKTWRDCVLSAVTYAIGTALERTACRRLYELCVDHGVARPECLSCALWAALAGQTLTLDFTEESFEATLRESPGAEPESGSAA